MKTIFYVVITLFILLYSGLQLGFFHDVDFVATNTSHKSISLLSRADPNSEIRAIMKPGERLKYAYSGKTKKWDYLYFKKQILAVSHKHINLGYLIRGKYFIPKNIVQIVAFFCSLALIFIILKRFFLRNEKINHKYKPNINNNVNTNNYNQDDIYAIIKSTEDRLAVAHETTIQKIKLNEKEKLDRLIKIFFHDILNDSNKIQKPTIEDMKNAYCTLKEKYEKALSNAKVFGIDLRNNNIESLLKGRLFEICIAQIVSKDLGYRILEWTPDKGFEHDIFIEANLNLDFILADKSNNEFAIECKYRSKTQKIAKLENAISWAAEKQVIRYKDFSIKRAMPVFIALGISGNPDKPSLISIPPLDSIQGLSDAVDFRTNAEKAQGLPHKKQCVCNLDQLQQWKIQLNSPEIPWIRF